jgi:hypothetical protein
MVWIGGVSERSFVTAHAVGGCAGEPATRVTLCAGDRDMGSRQGEACHAVVKLGAQPC